MGHLGHQTPGAECSWDWWRRRELNPFVVTPRISPSCLVMRFNTVNRPWDASSTDPWQTRQTAPKRTETKNLCHDLSRHHPLTRGNVRNSRASNRNAPHPLPMGAWGGGVELISFMWVNTDPHSQLSGFPDR